MNPLLDMTALPNPHPALVHFPIALAAVELLFDEVALLRLRWAPAEWSVAILWGLAAVGVSVAYVADLLCVLEGSLLSPDFSLVFGHLDPLGHPLPSSQQGARLDL